MRHTITLREVEGRYSVDVTNEVGTIVFSHADADTKENMIRIAVEAVGNDDYTIVDNTKLTALTDGLCNLLTRAELIEKIGPTEYEYLKDTMGRPTKKDLANKLADKFVQYDGNGWIVHPDAIENARELNLLDFIAAWAV